MEMIPNTYRRPAISLSHTHTPDPQASGQYKPVVEMRPGELRRVRAVNTLITKNIYFGVPETMRKDCEITIFAYDGVYLTKPRKQNDIFLPSGTYGHSIVWVGMRSSVRVRVCVCVQNHGFRLRWRVSTKPRKQNDIFLPSGT